MRIIVILLFLVLLVNIYSITISYENILDISISGEFGDLNSIVEYPYLFANSRYGLMIYELSAINDSLNLLSTLPIPGYAKSLLKIEDFIFINANENTTSSNLYKVSVSDPINPQLTDTIIFENSQISGLRDYGNNLAIHQLINETVFELTFFDHNTLEELESISIPSTSYSINDSIIACQSDPAQSFWSLYNISDIMNVTYLGTLNLNCSNYTNGNLHIIDDNLIVIAADAGLSFWNVTDSFNLEHLSDYQTVTSSTKFGGVTTLDHFLLVPQQSNGIEVVNISDPCNPVYESFWNIPEEFLYNIASIGSSVGVSNNNLFLGTNLDGILILNFENGLIDFSHNSIVNEIHDIKSLIYDNFLVSSSYKNGCRIIDISNPQQPFSVSSILENCGFIEQYKISNLLIVKYHNRNTNEQEISIFDLSVPEFPLLLSTVSLGSDICNIILNPSENNAFYLQTFFDNEKIMKYDISNPSSPYIVLDYELPANLGLGCFYNDYIYFLTRQNCHNLYVYSGMPLEAPVQENVIYNFGYENGSIVEIIHNFLQLRCFNDNDRFFDLSDPLNPYEIFSINRSSIGYENFIKDDILFSTTGYVIDIFDLSNNPTGQLQPFDSIILNSWFRGMNFTGNANTDYMFVTQLECISVYEYEIEYSGINEDEIVSKQQILSNHPNPFNPCTEIRFQISDFGQIENAKIEIYNLKGQKVKTFPVSESQSLQVSVTWDGTNQNNHPVGSGIYFYQLKVDGEAVASRKCLLLK